MTNVTMSGDALASRIERQLGASRAAARPEARAMAAQAERAEQEAAEARKAADIEQRLMAASNAAIGGVSSAIAFAHSSPGGLAVPMNKRELQILQGVRLHLALTTGGAERASVLQTDAASDVVALLLAQRARA